MQNVENANYNGANINGFTVYKATKAVVWEQIQVYQAMQLGLLPQLSLYMYLTRKERVGAS